MEPRASPSGAVSTSSPSSYVHVERRGAYAVLTLCREPVNGMNLDVWTQLLASLTALEEDSGCRGLILQSGLKKGTTWRALHRTERASLP